MKRVALKIAVVLSLTGLLQVQAREWTDRSGKFHFQGKFVKLKDGNVYLEKSEGKVFAIPLEKLSADDADYLRTLPETKPYFSDHREAEKPRESPRKMGEIHVDDPDSAGEIRRFTKLGWGVASLAFSADGRFLVVGKFDDAIEVFDVDKSVRVDFHEKLEGMGQVTCLAFSADGRKLLSGGNSGRIQVWDVHDGGRLTEANSFVGHKSKIRALCISPDGQGVLSGDERKTVKYWSLADYSEQFSLNGFGQKVSACVVSPNSKLGLASDGCQIDLIDLQKGVRMKSMSLGTSSSEASAISPNGHYAACFNTYELWIWDVLSGKRLWAQDLHELQWSARFTKDGRHVLCGGSGKVSLWEVGRAKKVSEFNLATIQYVQSMAVSPDGIHFAAAASSAEQDAVVFRLPPAARERIEQPAQDSKKD